ncbi:MAG TPA: LamG-like jellyroll fold domain-containing protein [Candidatus Kapabacteria bacterium]|nr:LamG-like jellyroll fold domain-containing protein [Candidatus Kapabacteria bacterium]
MYRRHNGISFLLLLIVAHIISAGTGTAQPAPLLSRPLPGPDMPAWAAYLYESPVNIRRVDSGFTAYYRTHPFEKNNYTRYYRRWQHAVEPYVLADGTLRLPGADELRERMEASNRARLSPAEAGGTWRLIGPNTTYCDGSNARVLCPEQVNIYGFDVAPSDPNVLYCMSETGGFFRTADKGLHWELRDIGFPSSSEAIAIHPTNPSGVFVGVNNGIVHTADAGRTWKFVLSQQDMWVYDIAVHPVTPSIVLAATNQGLYRSSDGGDTWKQIFSNSTSDLELNPANPNMVYALRYNAGPKQYELWKSTDAGLTFTIRSSGWYVAGTTDGAGRLTVTPADPKRVYAVLLASDAPRILRSDDNGETWRVTATGKTDALKMDNGQGYYDLSIAASHTDPNQLMVGTTTAFKSTDGGATFAPLGGYYGPFPIHPDIQEMKVLGNDAWICTDGGITLSNDFFTASSEARTNGIYASDFWGFGSGWNQDVLVGGRYHNGNTALTAAYGGAFLALGGGEAATGYVNPIDAQRTYHSDIGGWYLPDSINGTARSFSVGRFPNESYWAMEYSDMEWDPRSWNVVWIGNGNTVWRSTNGARSFDSIFSTSHADGAAQHIRIARSNPDVIYLTERSNTEWDGYLWKTTNGGRTWRQMPQLPVSAGERRCQQITVSAEDENELWVALREGSASNKVFHSTDGGATWTNMTTPAIGSMYVTDIVHQMGTDGGVYLLGGAGSVFYRNRGMSDWQPYATGLPAGFVVRAARPFYRDGVLRAASNFGIWEVPFYEASHPIAQPAVDKYSTACARDTFYFDDYSVLDHAGASWSWSFPGARSISSATARNPKVVYAGPGRYPVTLTVTNPHGSSTRTISEMVEVKQGECDFDRVPGMALDLSAKSNVVETPAIPGLRGAPGFTFMAWVKLNKRQDCFTQIVSNWGSDAGFGFGFAFMGYASNTNLTFYWRGVPYQLTTPFNLDTLVWTHVAVTVAPDTVTLFHDGVAWRYPGTFTPFDLSSTPFVLGNGVPGQCGDFDGELDEVRLYNRALTQAEVREAMHLTADQSQVARGLAAYYQFNESAPARFYDRVAASHAVNGGARQVASTAPVAGGSSYRMTVESGGMKDFTGTGLRLYLPAGGPFPNGEMVAYHLLARPDTLPTLNESLANSYWILRNWGTNPQFPLDSISFARVGTLSPADRRTPGLFSLYSRLPNEHLNAWTSAAVAHGVSADSTNGVVTLGPWPAAQAGQMLISTAGTSVLEANDARAVAAAALTAMPNPCDLQCIISYQPGPMEEGVEIRLYDVAGHLLLSTQQEVEESERLQYRLDMSRYPSGTYYVSANGHVAAFTKR